MLWSKVPVSSPASVTNALGQIGGREHVPEAAEVADHEVVQPDRVDRVPAALGADRLLGAPPVPQSYTHRMMAQEPIRTKGGTVRITDSSIFPVSKNMAAALVEIEPGGLRELHWHPNTDEWQYYISGQGRMGVFAAAGQARTFDFQAGDVGYVPFAMGHYVENTGTTPLRFLEMFKSDHYADLSLNQWMALTPPELLQEHLHLDKLMTDALQKKKSPIVPG